MIATTNPAEIVIEGKRYSVAEAFALLSALDKGDEFASIMPLTGDTHGMAKASDTSGQFILRVSGDERPTTRFVVHIERIEDEQ